MPFGGTCLSTAPRPMARAYSGRVRWASGQIVRNIRNHPIHGYEMGLNSKHKTNTSHKFKPSLCKHLPWPQKLLPEKAQFSGPTLCFFSPLIRVRRLRKANPFFAWNMKHSRAGISLAAYPKCARGQKNAEIGGPALAPSAPSTERARPVRGLFEASRSVRTTATVARARLPRCDIPVRPPAEQCRWTREVHLTAGLKRQL